MERRINFSNNGSYVSIATFDGLIYIWNINTSELITEYKPSSHLTAKCSCLNWAPSKPCSLSSPRKKKLKTTADDFNKLELLAIGTEIGSILLYSVTKGSLYTNLSKGHSDKINDIAWQMENESLFTCSSDKTVVEWNLKTFEIKTSWKADDNEIYSICSINDNKLLTASSTIKLWDLKDKTVIRTFIGHANEIWRLIGVNVLDEQLKSNGYFVSAALNDRVLNAWQIKDEKANGKPLATYVLTEEAINVDISVPRSKDETVLISAVTKSGEVLIFEHRLNGKISKPLKPCVTIKIVNKHTGKTEPIIGVKHINTVEKETKKLNKNGDLNGKDVHEYEDDREFYLIVGTLVAPHFEKISYKSCERKTIIKRDYINLNKQKTNEVEKSLKVVKPVTDNDVRSFGPSEARTQSKKLSNLNQSSTLNNCSSDLLTSTLTTTTTEYNDKNDLTMSIEQRLKGYNLDELNDKNETPKTDSLIHLLIQGLQSNDNRMLNSVLQRSDSVIMRNTITKLPIEYIKPLLNVLLEFFNHKGERNIIYLNWFETLLQLKTSIILSLPELNYELIPLIEKFKFKCGIFERMCKLRGKINLILSEIDKERKEPNTDKEPLLKYQESSSEDEDDENDDEDMSSTQEMKDLMKEETDDENNEYEDADDDDDEEIEESEDEGNEANDEEEEDDKESSDDQSMSPILNK